jgi:hypothetical protein
MPCRDRCFPMPCQGLKGGDGGIWGLRQRPRAGGLAPFVGRGGALRGVAFRPHIPPSPPLSPHPGRETTPAPGGNPPVARGGIAPGAGPGGRLGGSGWVLPTRARSRYGRGAGGGPAGSWCAAGGPVPAKERPEDRPLDGPQGAPLVGRTHPDPSSLPPGPTRPSPPNLPGGAQKSPPVTAGFLGSLSHARRAMEVSRAARMGVLPVCTVAARTTVSKKSTPSGGHQCHRAGPRNPRGGPKSIAPRPVLPRGVKKSSIQGCEFCSPSPGIGGDSCPGHN